MDGNQTDVQNEATYWQQVDEEATEEDDVSSV